ncbi:MAG: ABC transporter permease [Candidatus Helarchaeota archaeon]
MITDQQNNEVKISKKEYPSFYSKFIGALFLSSKSYYNNLTSKNAWHGIFIFIVGSSLLSLILSTTTWEPFINSFYHYIIFIDLKIISFNIYFSPFLFIISELGFIITWILIILLISYIKKIKITGLFNSGFILSPSILSILYFLNKYILKISISTFGEILIITIIIWCILTSMSFLFSVLDVKIGAIMNLSIKSILNRKKRSIGTILGISISVALIVVPIPLITGYYYQLGVIAGRYQYAEYIIITNSTTNLYSDSYIRYETINLVVHDNIQVTCPQKYFEINISKDNKNFSLYFRGLNYTIFNRLRNPSKWYLKNPEYMNESEIIIGSEIASILNITQIMLPIKINLTFKTIEKEVSIIGIFQTTSHYDGCVIGNINLSNILNPSLSNFYSIIECKLYDYTNSESVIFYINNNINGLNANRENQMNFFINNLISRTITSLILLSYIIFCLMIFGMYHSTRVIINDSKEEIFILKAIGANNSQIIRKFLYESLVLSLIGGLLGVFGGVFLCYGVSFIIYLFVSVHVSPFFDPLFILFVMIMTICAGLMGGFIPSYMIVKKNYRREIK